MTTSSLRNTVAKIFPAVIIGMLNVGVAIADEYLSYDAKEATKIVEQARIKGKVGSSFDFRITNTDRSYNYKLRATWMTPSVVRAAARLIQLSNGMSEDQTGKLVRQGEMPGETVILVEIDPREGSGVIPRDWVAFLGPSGKGPTSDRTVKGKSEPTLRDVKALSGGLVRDYSYDQFWIVFPLRGEDGNPLFSPLDREAELTVRIYDKVGKVSWTLPDAIRKYVDAEAQRDPVSTSLE